MSSLYKSQRSQLKLKTGVVSIRYSVIYTEEGWGLPLYIQPGGKGTKLMYQVGKRLLFIDLPDPELGWESHISRATVRVCISVSQRQEWQELTNWKSRLFNLSISSFRCFRLLFYYGNYADLLYIIFLVFSLEHWTFLACFKYNFHIKYIRPFNIS